MYDKQYKVLTYNLVQNKINDLIKPFLTVDFTSSILCLKQSIVYSLI